MPPSGPPPPAPSPGPRRPPRPRPGCREDSLDSDWSDGGAAGIMRTVCEGGGPGHGGGRGNESLFGASKHTDPFPSVPRNTRMVLHGALASVCVGGEGLSDCVVVLIFTQRVRSCVFFAWHRPSTCPPKCLRGSHLERPPSLLDTRLPPHISRSPPAAALAEPRGCKPRTCLEITRLDFSMCRARVHHSPTLQSFATQQPSRPARHAWT